MDTAEAFSQDLLCVIARIFELSSERRFSDWAMKKYRDCSNQVKETRFHPDLVIYRSNLPNPNTFITYQSLCSEAKQEYRDLVASNRYKGHNTKGIDDAPTFLAVIDSTVQKAFNTMLSNNSFNNLQDNSANNNTTATGSNNNKNDKKCDFCHKPGHLEADCRKKKSNNNDGNTNNHANTSTEEAHWTKVPPTENLDTSTLQKYGNACKYCSVCKSWRFHWATGHDAWKLRKQNTNTNDNNTTGGRATIAIARESNPESHAWSTHGGLFSVPEG